MNILEHWLAPDFWRQILQEAAAWAVASLPRILIILIGVWLLLNAYRLGLHRLQALLYGRLDGEDAGEREKRVTTLVGILRRAGTITLWFLATMLVLVELGIDIGPLIAGAGVLGLAVGFGAQELVRDVIAGFFNLLENHVRAGDIVQINGTGGMVESIGLRTTMLRDVSGVVHVFQNGKINTIANMTKGWSAAVFDVGIAYKEDTDKVAEVMAKVAATMRQEQTYSAQILADLEIFGVEAFGDSAVILKARFKTQPGQQWVIAREYRRRLKQAFDAAGIEIPFPQRTLHLGDTSGPLGAALRQGGAAPRASTTKR